MKIIDSHAHFAGDTPECIELMRRLDLRILNNCYDGSAHGTPDENGRKQADRYAKLTTEHPDMYAWVTTFEAAPFEEPDFVETTIAQLDADFARGAIGCKIWKNIGLELRRANGELLMVDEPLFDPIFEHLAGNDKTLLIHTGEPWEQWQPLRKGSVHSRYRLTNNLHFDEREDIHPHERYIQVLDNICRKHPKLRLVGAHLGSMEYSLKEMAKRLDKYPNFAVDTAGPARTADLALNDNDDVRNFLVKYQDRIMFGTDLLNDKMLSQYCPEEQADQLEQLKMRYADAPRYYTTTDIVIIKIITTPGLGLPDDVTDKLFVTNVRKWYPGLPADWC